MDVPGKVADFLLLPKHQSVHPDRIGAVFSNNDVANITSPIDAV